MTPKQFQQRVCQGIVARLNAQGYPAKGKTRNKAAFEMVCGAAYALEALDSEQLTGMLTLAVLASARGAEVVESVATTGNVV